jgi:hypothetical protein
MNDPWNSKTSQLVINCNQLKMLLADGKFYKTDATD